MNIIINTDSMIPIYEQIVDAIKKMIAAGTLQEGDALPSVRSLANELKISALTVKKAYDALEAEGFIATVHGKGSYVKAVNNALLREERCRELERALLSIAERAKPYGFTADELREMLHIILAE